MRRSAIWDAFCAANRLPTLLDERAGYRIIAARGDTKGLVLSYMPEFKLALQRADPAVAADRGEQSAAALGPYGPCHTALPGTLSGRPAGLPL